MARIIYMGGAKGCGKSTLANEIRKTDADVAVVHAGILTKSIGEHIFKQSWFDLHEVDKDYARFEMLERLKVDGHATVLLDSHYGEIHFEKYYDGIQRYRPAPGGTA